MRRCSAASSALNRGSNFCGHPSDGLSYLLFRVLEGSDGLLSWVHSLHLLRSRIQRCGEGESYPQTIRRLLLTSGAVGNRFREASPARQLCVPLRWLCYGLPNCFGLPNPPSCLFVLLEWHGWQSDIRLSSRNGSDIPEGWAHVVHVACQYSASFSLAAALTKVVITLQGELSNTLPVAAVSPGVIGSLQATRAKLH